MDGEELRVKGVGGGGLEFKYVSLQKKVFFWEIVIFDLMLK